MTNKQLKNWFDKLPLADRLLVQKFVIILYYIGEID